MALEYKFASATLGASERESRITAANNMLARLGWGRLEAAQGDHLLLHGMNPSQVSAFPANAGMMLQIDALERVADLLHGYDIVGRNS
ncbi:hypothetical protein AB0L40_08485 [Patulibacter sp. NPDC049589]|uniref:hypothetical protein n=1 Tax=Patulibacter sp. NPDC049589 TaxID=3154731 RepID=UPI00341F0C16